MILLRNSNKLQLQFYVECLKGVDHFECPKPEVKVFSKALANTALVPEIISKRKACINSSLWKSC